jgi:hypothetical protein
VREIEWSKPNVRLQVGEEEDVDAAAEGVRTESFRSVLGVEHQRRLEKKVQPLGGARPRHLRRPGGGANQRW